MTPTNNTRTPPGNFHDMVYSPCGEQYSPGQTNGEFKPPTRWVGSPSRHPSTCSSPPPTCYSTYITPTTMHCTQVAAQFLSLATAAALFGLTDWKKHISTPVWAWLDVLMLCMYVYSACFFLIYIAERCWAWYTPPCGEVLLGEGQQEGGNGGQDEMMSPVGRLWCNAKCTLHGTAAIIMTSWLFPALDHLWQVEDRAGVVPFVVLGGLEVVWLGVACAAEGWFLYTPQHCIPTPQQFAITIPLTPVQSRSASGRVESTTARKGWDEGL